MFNGGHENSMKTCGTLHKFVTFSWHWLWRIWS